MLTFERKYFFSAFLLFLTEVLIAVYLNDTIIRPYIGDLLVVILIYCSLKAVFKVASTPTAIGVLLFSYLLEGLQHFNLVAALGLKENALANTILGNSFAWMDMLAYTLGTVVILAWEGFGTKNLGRSHQ